MGAEEHVWTEVWSIISSFALTEDAKSTRSQMKAVTTHLEEENLAHTMQRGQKFGPTKADKMLADRKQQLAALKIQTMSRNRKAKDLVNVKRKESHAATSIQKIHRAKAAKKAVEEKRIGKIEGDAAKKIQAIQRGKQGRLRVQTVKETNAAEKLQALQRGRMGRAVARGLRD